MKTIKDAVLELGGKLPNRTHTKYSNAAGWYISRNGKLSHSTQGMWFEPEEFESEAKRLGYINGYRWGVEYATNGKRPDLADDVLVVVRHSDGELMKNPYPISEWAWVDMPNRSFIIKDTRFKPADTSYMNQCEYKGVADIDQIKVECMCVSGNEAEAQSLTHKPVDELIVSHSSIDGIHAGDRISIEGLKRKPSDEPKNLFDGEMPFAGTLTVEPAPQDNSWHERGELPPISTQCEWNGLNGGYWVQCEVIDKYQDKEMVVFNTGKYRNCRYEILDLASVEFRPIRTEREKVIEAAIMVVESNNSTSESIYDTLYNAGMLVLPPNKSDTED